MSGVKHTPVVAPCPWCGGNAKCNELRRGNYRREGDNYQVVCNKCRARGPLVQDGRSEAIAAWNQHARARGEQSPNHSDQKEVGNG